MVMNRAHLKDPDAPRLKGNDLDDNRQGFENVEPPAKMSKSSVLVRIAMLLSAAESQGPVSPMNILAGCWL